MLLCVVMVLPALRRTRDMVISLLLLLRGVPPMRNFFPKNKYVNDAKLRLSWGMTGSMAGVSNYAPLSLISAGGASYNGSAGFQIRRMPVL